MYEDAVVEAMPHPLVPDPDAVDEEFTAGANRALQDAVELLCRLVPSHRPAAAVVVHGDRSSVRESSSLSPEYAAWSAHRTPVVGVGTHRWLVHQRRPVRLTQAELASHPAWSGCGAEAGRHPPMRGWLAAPLLDPVGVCRGLLPSSDRYPGDHTAADEAALVRSTDLLVLTLESLRTLRGARRAT